MREEYAALIIRKHMNTSTPPHLACWTQTFSKIRVGSQIDLVIINNHDLCDFEFGLGSKKI